jgi:hypothetical protein
MNKIEERPDVAPIALTNEVPPMADYMRRAEAPRPIARGMTRASECLCVCFSNCQTTEPSKDAFYWMRPLSKKVGYDH